MIRIEQILNKRLVVQNLKIAAKKKKKMPRLNKNPTRMPAQSDSAIGQHLLNNPKCAQDYQAEQFQIVARVHTEAHLRVLEATFIHTRAPALCKQKAYVQTLHLF